MNNQGDRYIYGKLAKPIAGVPNHFCRCDGSIWYRAKRRPSTGKFLKRKTFKSNAGYATLGIGYGDNRKTRTLHILMLESWIGPKESKDYEAAHYDGNKKNNAIDNLRWAKKGTFSDAVNAPSNSFFELTNRADAWFHQKDREGKVQKLDKPVKLEKEPVSPTTVLRSVYG